MSKSKILVFSAVAAAAVVAIVLCGKPSGETGTADVVSSRAIPEVAAQAAAQIVAATPPASTNQTPTARGTLPFVLTSATPFTKPLRLAAEAMGAKTVSSISRNALLVEVDEAARARLAADSRFDDVSEYLPAEKVQPRLAELIAGGATSVDVSIVSLAAADRERVMSCLKAGGGEMLTGCINEGDTIRAKLPAALVAELATRGDVRWMEGFSYPRLMNDKAVEPAAMNVREVWDMHGLTGAGQKISTSDSGIDTGDLTTMHKDLCDRVLDIKVVMGASKTDVSGHGTHTAGSIVGTGAMSGGQIRGTAYGANLYAWFCGAPDKEHIYTPATTEALYTYEGAWDAYIHSASWGSTVNGEYTSECANHDRYVWEHPEFLPVFAAGNEGEKGAYTVDAPGSAKNVLTVGATQNLRKGGDGGWGNGDPKVTAVFSSRGPCRDGRTKPDIAAPGVGVLSTRSYGVDYSYGIYDDYYAYDSGTSMATPLTAGAVALVRQWLVEEKGFEDEDGKRPTAALMKAVIMGGAKGAAVPNRNQGWGRVDLAETLFPSDGRAVKLIDRIPFAQDFVTNIVVETTDAAPLDVQLVWVDYPGSSAGGQKVPRLVNDIDLTVESRILGEPQFRYGNGGTEPDTLNNAESVRIANAVPTKYVITVTCKTIVHDYTEGGAAALYIRGAFDPEAEPEMPAYVHLKKLNRDFMSLGRALKAVQDEDETVEILDWVFFDKSVTLTNDCTIAATNEDAAASYVVRQAGASLTVTNATVTLSNVVFAASGATLFSVENGGCLRLGPKVDMGVGLDQVSVTAAAADGIDLAGELTRKFLFRCAAASQIGETFGTYSCAESVASNCAPMIVCADDIDRETRGRIGPNQTLVWQHVNVPLDEAAGYYVDDAGNTNTYFRMERALAEFAKAYKNGKASEFVVLRDGTLPVSFAVNAPLTLCGEGTVRPALTVETTDEALRFGIVEGGSLTISNLVFCGIADERHDSDYGFIKVNGGELTLDDGAVLSNITGNVSYGSGVIDLMKGTATMRPGAAILNCKANGGSGGNGYGGAIYVYGDGCNLRLEGGRIADCYAQSHGGGIYAEGWPNAAAIDISGDLIVTGNMSGNHKDADDIYMRREEALPGFRLVGEVDGKVGIRYSNAAMSGKKEEGFAFMTNAVGNVGAATLRSFVNNRNENMIATTNATTGMLVWETRIDDGQCAPADAVALLIDADWNTNFYSSVARAFEYMGDNSPYVVEVRKGCALATDVVLHAGCNVTLRQAAALAPGSCPLKREGDVGFVIPSDASLTLTNIVLCREMSVAPGEITNPVINVEGGKLTMAAGSCVSNILGNTSRNANAVTVWNGGTFTMLPGSKIVHCNNYFNYDKVTSETETQHYGVGGGVLVDGGSTAYLHGGEITDCRATRGGGVCVCNRSKVYVSGEMRIFGNYWIAHGGGVGGASNLLVEDLAEVYLDGELSDKVGTGDFIRRQRDTNLVAKVSSGWAWSVDSLTNSAAMFSHDSLAAVTGVAVTNGTKALVVWSNAVKNGVYTNVEDDVAVEYGVAGKLPANAAPLAVQLFTVTTNTPSPIAFASIASANASCVLTLTNLVKGAKYTVFKMTSCASGNGTPFTNFTAEADGPFELEVPMGNVPVFWSAAGSETYTTNYINK